MELARAWTRRPAGCEAPADFDTLLRSHPSFIDAEIISGTPEDLVTFDAFGGPRNADLNLICRSRQGTIVISVEAKADETYGNTVDRERATAARKLAEGQPTNAHRRIEALVKLFVPPGHQSGTLRYQLLTASAATLKLAERHRAAAAMLVVHEFVNGQRRNGKVATEDRKVRDNAAALNAFVRTVSHGSIDAISSPAIVGPFPLDIATPFYVGKLQTDLSQPV